MFKRTKGKIFVGLISILLMLFFAGTTYAEWSLTEAAKPYRGTTLVVLGEAYAPWDAYKVIAKDFEKQTGIKLEMRGIHMPDILTKFTADAIAKTGEIDVFDFAGYGIGRFVKMGWVLPTSHFLENPKVHRPGFSPAKEFPEMWDAACLYEGDHYNIPYDFHPNFVVYRKDLVEDPGEKLAFALEYGYEIPNPPKIWEQAYDLAEFFTRDKGETLAGKTLDKPFYGWVQSMKRHLALAYDLVSHVVSMGGNLLGSQNEVVVEKAAFRRGVESFLNLQKFCPPGVTGFAWDIPTSLWLDGRVFADVECPDVYPYWEDAEVSKSAGKIGYALVPGTGALAPLAHTWNISKFSRHPEAGWLWLQYISRYETQKKFNELCGASYRPDVLNDPDFDDVPWIGAMRKAKVLVSMPKTPGTAEIIDSIALYISKAAIGELSIDEALRQLAEAEKKILR